MMVDFVSESAVFSCRNPLFGPKLCSGSGKEFKDLLTSLIVSRSVIDSLIFSLDLFEFILHIVVANNFLPRNFCFALTENTHLERSQKSLDSPK